MCSNVCFFSMPTAPTSCLCFCFYIVEKAYDCALSRCGKTWSRMSSRRATGNHPGSQRNTSFQPQHHHQRGIVHCSQLVEGFPWPRNTNVFLILCSLLVAAATSSIMNFAAVSSHVQIIDQNMRPSYANTFEKTDLQKWSRTGRRNETTTSRNEKQ